MPFGFGRGRKKGSRGRGFFGSRDPRGFGWRRPPSNCICPNCGAVVPHHLGLPCFQTKCPRCSSPMTRQFFSEEQ